MQTGADRGQLVPTGARTSGRFGNQDGTDFLVMEYLEGETGAIDRSNE